MPTATREVMPTAPEPPSPARVHRAQWGRRVTILVLVAIVVLGLIGLFGVRTRTTEASKDGWTVQVHYASIARPGLSVPWNLEVDHDGGFSGPIRIAVANSYFDTVDVTRLNPAPVSSTSDGDRVIWQFDPPPGDRFAVSANAEVDPSAGAGRHGGQVTLLDGGGRPVVGVTFRTWLWP